MPKREFIFIYEDLRTKDRRVFESMSMLVGLVKESYRTIMRRFSETNDYYDKNGDYRVSRLELE